MQMRLSLPCPDRPRSPRLTGALAMLLALGLFAAGCAGGRPASGLPAESLLPGTLPEMNTPGYWIGRHPDPDRLIMTPDEIAGLNARIISELRTVRYIPAYAEAYPGEILQEALAVTLEGVRSKNYLLLDGRRPSDRFFEAMADNLDSKALPEALPVRFGFTVGPANQRVLPTEVGLYTPSLNAGFDRLQNSLLDLATPLAVLHESADGQWLYVVAPLCTGWVKRTQVALCSRWQLEHFLFSEDFVVAVSAKADLYADPGLRRHSGHVRMGVRLPRWQGGSPTVEEVLVPVRLMDGGCTFKTAYMRREEVHEDFLPYTARHAIHQAFRLLHAPYGWGGMYGEQDCSRFVQEVFACFGIGLPRNSSLQAEVGRLKAAFASEAPRPARLEALAHALPGITTLRMNGHIMLLLGLVDGEPFAIHATWAFSEPASRSTNLRVVNRTVVSSLHLGEGTPGGSLLERLTTVREVRAGP